MGEEKVRQDPSIENDSFGVLAHPVERSYGIAEVASSSLAHSTIEGTKKNLKFI